MPRAFFFGCWNETGHFMWRPGKRWAGDFDRAFHGDYERPHLDGSYAPRTRLSDGAIVWDALGHGKDRWRLLNRSEERPQGEFLLHRRDGFTLIAWWDRTQGDTRGACNSTFLLEGDHGVAGMLAGLAERFPHVLENLARAGVELRWAVTP